MISVKSCSDEPVHISSDTQIDEISKVNEPFSDWLFFCNKIMCLGKTSAVHGIRDLTTGYCKGCNIQLLELYFFLPKTDQDDTNQSTKTTRFYIVSFG